MNNTLLTLALFIVVLAALSSGVPLYKEDLDLYHFEPYFFQPSQQYSPYQIPRIRERRSPQQLPPPPPPPPQQPNRGSIGITGEHTQGQGGYVRGEYNHKIWENRNGARLDANTYYQRNWGTPGPRQDYGGGVRLSIPLGGRRY